MNLQSFFFITQGIAAIFVSFFFLVSTVMIISFMVASNRLKKKVSMAAGESIAAAEEAKEYAGKIGKAAVDYLIIKAFNIIKKKD